MRGPIEARTLRQPPFSMAALAVLATVAVLGFAGLNLGYGSNSDSRPLFETTVTAIQGGEYIPSRGYGVPLYEFMAAFLHPLGGTLLDNAYSLLATLAAVLIFWRLLLLREGAATPGAGLWALAGFALNPLVLLQASSPNEWAQTVLFMMCALYCTVAWLRTGGFPALVAYGASACALVLTRPDAALMCIALFIAVLWEVKLDRRRSRAFFAANAVAALASITTLVVLNHGLSFLHSTSAMIGPQQPLRRIAIGALGFLNVFGVAGCLALAIALGRVLRNRAAQVAPGRGLAGTDLFEKLCLVAWPIMIVRFAALPDKLEYLMVLIPITLLAVASRRQPVAVTAIVACSLIVNSVFTVSLFERTGTGDRLAFALHLNKSALLQDWNDRKAQQRALDPQFTARIAAVALAGADGSATRLSFGHWAMGFTSDRNDLVLSENQLYKIDNPRFPGARSESRSYRHIIACNQVFYPDNVGWRVLQPPQVYISADSGSDDWLRCRPAGNHDGDLPVASR